MKNLQVLSPLLTLVLGSVALAQAGNLPDAPEPQESASTQRQGTPAANPPESPQPPADNELVSQARPYPRFPPGPMGAPRGPMGPQRGPMGYPRRGPYRSPYSSPFRPQPSLPDFSPGGALVGFGLGAAVGAAGTANLNAHDRVAAALLGGGLFALIGGAVGGIHSHSFRDWENAKSRRHRIAVPRPSEPEVEASSAPAQAPSADPSRDSERSTSTAMTTEGTGGTE
jgi:hypothetical protein